MFDPREDGFPKELNNRFLISKASFIDALFDLFLPNKCLICSQAIAPSFFICEKCIKTLSELTPKGAHASTESINRVYFFDYYDSPLTELIKAYKYASHRSLSRFLALFLNKLIIYWNLPKTILGVPSHLSSVRNRGFSSVLEIVKTCQNLFSSQLNSVSLIKRKGKYLPQASIQKHELRQINAINSYAFTKGKVPEEILLFDDIMTSGYTLEAIARLIKEKRKDCKITAAVLVKKGE